MRKVYLLILALFFVSCGDDAIVNDPYRLVYADRFTYRPTDMELRTAEGVQYFRFDLARQYRFTSGLIPTGMFLWESLPPEKSLAEPIENATTAGFTLDGQRYTFRPIAKTKNQCGEYFVYELGDALGSLECD